MCIRDRFGRENGQSILAPFFPKAQWLSYEDCLLVQDAEPPVSYTHLDVYKRQLRTFNTVNNRAFRTWILFMHQTSITLFSLFQRRVYNFCRMVIADYIICLLYTSIIKSKRMLIVILYTLHGKKCPVTDQSQR